MKHNVEYIDFNAAKWLVGTANLTPEERGAYIQICALIYANQERPDEDYSFLGRVFGCNPRKARALVKALVDKDKVQIIDGKLSQKKSEFELKRAQTRIENCSNGGRKKAENEAKRRDNNGLGSAPQTSEEASITTTTTTTKELTPTPSLGQDDPNFQEFFSVFPIAKRGSEDMAFKAWRRVTKLADPATIIAGARRYAATPEVKNGFCTWPAVWLKNGGWLAFSEAPEAPPPAALVIDWSQLQEWHRVAHDVFGVAVFRSWFLQCRVEGDFFIAPTRFVKEWIYNNYWDKLKHQCFAGADIKMGTPAYA